MSELMRLRVSRGWAVLDNKFYDTIPIPQEESVSDSFIENWHEGFVEDVLWIRECHFVESGPELPESDRFYIDISWLPDSRMNGQYHARLGWRGAEELRWIARFESKDRFEIRDKIEFWMEDVKGNYARYKLLPEVD